MKNIRKAVLTSLGIVAVSISAQGAHAANVCHDFSNLVPGTQYNLGDVVTGPDATVTMKDYILNGVIANPAFAGVFVTNTMIAGGSAPEIRTYLLNPRVTPNTPALRVKMRVSEATGGAAPHANIEVNGAVHEVTSGLATANGKIVGDSSNGGLAMVNVNLAPTLNGNWNQGTLELVAIQGQINTFTVGGVQVFIDDQCWQN